MSFFAQYVFNTGYKPFTRNNETYHKETPNVVFLPLNFFYNVSTYKVLGTLCTNDDSDPVCIYFYPYQQCKYSYNIKTYDLIKKEFYSFCPGIKRHITINIVTSNQPIWWIFEFPDVFVIKKYEVA